MVPAAAVGGKTPASWWLGLSNKRKGELLGTREGGARRGHHWRRQWRLGVWAMRAAASSTPFISELKAVERLTCAPRWGNSVQVAAWAVGAATTCTGAGQVRWRGHWLGGAAGTRGARGLGEQGGGTAVPGVAHVLTPKFGKESDLWVQLGGESVWWKERFS
jgi:hypothetical protein